jgi:prepilin-type N-terminal cleavage/methylation domain-containing protein
VTVTESRTIRSEEGFTLIEMMISIGVLSIIIVPILGSFLLGILETTSSEERTADSASAQLASSFLMPDIESSETIARNSAPVCATSGTSLLSMTWNEPTASGGTLSLTEHKVDYVERVVSGRHELHRWHCYGLIRNDDLVVFNLNSDNPAAFSVACDDATCAAPKTVEVDIEAFSQAPGEGSSYRAAGPFKIELTAVRRFGVGT